MSTSNTAKVLRILEQHILRTYEGQPGAPEAWRNLPEIPTSGEVCNSQAVYGDDEDSQESLRMLTNIIDGPWDSKGEYVRNHYQLTREDGISPLRDAIGIYRLRPSITEGHGGAIYANVRIIGVTFATQGPAFRVEFSCSQSAKPIMWRQSKRLQQGTIVALSPIRDNFKTFCKVAIVAARPLEGLEHNPSHVDLFWGNVHEADFDPTVEYVMIEARTGYFEASRHMLVAMQKVMTENTPFMDHLVDLKATVDAPEMIMRKPVKNLSSIVPVLNQKTARTVGATNRNELKKVNILDQWPEFRGVPLDSSQLEALRRICGKKLAIIQGPPGTGELSLSCLLSLLSPVLDVRCSRMSSILSCLAKSPLSGLVFASLNRPCTGLDPNNNAGKTFVSVAALKVMFDNWSTGDPPIIVAAHTNHALDQLLTLVAGWEPKFCRLGGRAALDNVVVRERTLFELRARAHHGGPEAKASVRKCRNTLECSARALKEMIMKALSQGPDEPGMMLEYGVITEEQYKSIVEDEWSWAPNPNLYEGHGIFAYWLGQDQMVEAPRCPPIDIHEQVGQNPDFEALDEEELEAQMDEQDTLNGAWWPYREKFVGQHFGWNFESVGPTQLKSKSDLWDIPPDLRGAVYYYMRQQLKSKLLYKFHEHMMEYKHCAQNLKIAQWHADASIIMKAKIKLIGCTTTGLSKYRGLLAALQPKLLLIEEAAETLEGNILAAMFESLQQLILVGDHHQLRAKTHCQRLSGPPHNLHISMFERLVTNGVEYTMLNEQRRMIPAIRQLLEPFYPGLRDHQSVVDRVKNQVPIPGIGGRSTFTFHHEWSESRGNSSSRFNVEEATMITGFFAYLVRRGVHPSKITVLTFYLGQKKLITRKLKNQPGIASEFPFKVSTVDSYQGEENDILLISLVRSNPEGHVGFLYDQNRVIVALSRARRGLFIFGNFKCLCSTQLWSTITEIMVVKWRIQIGAGLPIACDKHGTTVEVKNPHQWNEVINGCGIECGDKLTCGHICPLKCHFGEHNNATCKVPCQKKRACGHLCIKTCAKPCRCVCDLAVVSQHKIPDTGEESWNLDSVLGGNDKISSTSQWREWSTHESGEAEEKTTVISRRAPDARGAPQEAAVKATTAHRDMHGDSRPRTSRQTALSPTNSGVGRAGMSIGKVSNARKWREWDTSEADRADTKVQGKAQTAKNPAVEAAVELREGAMQWHSTLSPRADIRQGDSALCLPMPSLLTDLPSFDGHPNNNSSPLNSSNGSISDDADEETTTVAEQSKEIGLPEATAIRTKPCGENLMHPVIHERFRCVTVTDGVRVQQHDGEVRSSYLVDVSTDSSQICSGESPKLPNQEPIVGHDWLNDIVPSEPTVPETMNPMEFRQRSDEVLPNLGSTLPQCGESSLEESGPFLFTPVGSLFLESTTAESTSLQDECVVAGTSVDPEEDLIIF